MANFAGYILALVVAFVGLPLLLSAQDISEADGAPVVSPTAVQDTVTSKKTKPLRNQEDNMKEPARAALMSAILPGLGQAYNGKYWKLPIVYGGFVGLGIAYDFNHTAYTQARDYLVYLTDTDPDNNAIVPLQYRSLQATNLRRRVDQFRRDRDFTTILMFLWYGLVIADAAVDAHLKGFNVSDDLSGIIKPSMLPVADGVAPAVSLVLTFRN